MPPAPVAVVVPPVGGLGAVVEEHPHGIPVFPARYGSGCQRFVTLRRPPEAAAVRVGVEVVRYPRRGSESRQFTRCPLSVALPSFRFNPDQPIPGRHNPVRPRLPLRAAPRLCLRLPAVFTAAISARARSRTVTSNERYRPEWRVQFAKGMAAAFGRQTDCIGDVCSLRTNLGRWPCQFRSLSRELSARGLLGPATPVVELSRPARDRRVPFRAIRPDRSPLAIGCAEAAR